MRDLVVASYNVHKCVGHDRRFDPARTLEVIAEIAPDIIALQEADRRFGDRAGLLDLDALHAMTGLVPVPLAANSTRRSHGWHGNVVLVREAEIEEVQPIRLPGLEPRGAVMIDLAPRSGGRLRVVATHLGLLRASRLAQAEALVAALDNARFGRDARPSILMGDLNEWRLRRRSSLGPLAARKPASVRPVASFPARRPILALDRIMGCPATELHEFRSHDTPLARVASDHLPVRALLRLDPTAGAAPADARMNDDAAPLPLRRAGGAR